MNQINITGRLTEDPKLHEYSEDKHVCRMRLAVDGMGRGRNADGRQNAGFIDVAEFGAPGVASANRLTKGWKVAVEGRLEQHTYETDTGEKRSTFGVIGHVEHLAAPQNREGGERQVQAETEVKTEAEASIEEKSVDPRTPGSTQKASGSRSSSSRASNKREQVGTER
jgi:single-strand DNA-binding protein